LDGFFNYLIINVRWFLNRLYTSVTTNKKLEIMKSINPTPKITATYNERVAKNILNAIYNDRSIVGDVKVEVQGKKAILKGTVETNEQRDAVVAIVIGTGDISHVENNLRIDWMC
jgi:osmotically-inducible protein OsmY